MSVEKSSSLSRMISYDGSGYVDANRNSASQGYAAKGLDAYSDNANEKKRHFKWKKRKTGLPFCSAVYRWKFEIFVLILLAMIVVPEFRRLYHDSQHSTSVGLDGAKRQEALNPGWLSLNNEEQENEKHSNLNSMKMPYRKGLPCLELLPLEKLGQLNLPNMTPGPVKALLYVEGRPFLKSKVEERPNLSAFGGDQTMVERSKSFEVEATMKVHCGFCDEGNEFYIDSRDKSFMADCKIVVLTCAFGGGDDLYQPIGMTKASLAQVCYVAFWDEVTLKLQAVKGQEPDLQTRKVGLWRIVLVQNLPFSDQRRNGKIPKLLNHRLFPQARYSIWVDSKSQFRRDPIGVIEALLWRPNLVFAISQHGARSCVYDEGRAIVQKHKALPEEVKSQLDQYRSENFPEHALFNGHKALAEASVIVREHTPLTNLFMCNWFNEVARFTARDQLSFPYVLVKLQKMLPNMFTVCTRHAMVNSLGHAGKKPKPLVTNLTWVS